MRTCEAAGAVVVPIVGHMMQGSGWPDRLVLHRRFRGFVEAKRGSNPLTTQQEVNIKRAVQREFPALVARYFQDDMTLRVEGVLPGGRWMILATLDLVRCCSGRREDGAWLLDTLQLAWNEVFVEVILARGTEPIPTLTCGRCQAPAVRIGNSATPRCLRGCDRHEPTR
jgi:hypothetical protein